MNDELLEQQYDSRHEHSSIYDVDDPLAPARGCAWSLLASSALWAGVAALVWWWRR